MGRFEEVCGESGSSNLKGWEGVGGAKSVVFGSGGRGGRGGVNLNPPSLKLPEGAGGHTILVLVISN